MLLLILLASSSMRCEDAWNVERYLLLASCIRPAMGQAFQRVSYNWRMSVRQWGKHSNELVSNWRMSVRQWGKHSSELVSNWRMSVRQWGKHSSELVSNWRMSVRQWGKHFNELVTGGCPSGNGASISTSW